MWLCQFIDLLKFETRPCFLLNFGTANRGFTVHCKKGTVNNLLPFP